MSTPEIQKPRRHAREAALQILYQYDLSLHSNQTSVPDGAALAKDLSTHFEHFQIHPELREFAAQLVIGSLAEVTKIDALLEAHAANWKVSRMSSIDRSLLRMAIFEMNFIKDAPASVVIDEAIELGKQFGTAETPAFVNGILDAIKKSASIS